MRFEMANRIFRLPDVITHTGLSRSSIYAKIKLDEFPKPINLSERSVGWLQADIDKWIDKRIQISQQQD